MRTRVLTLLLSLCALALSAQPGHAGDPGWSLQALRTVSVPEPPDGSINPFPEQLCILSGCLSDYVIGGKKYPFRRLVSVGRDSFDLALPGDDDPVMRFSPRDLTSVSTICCTRIGNSYGFYQVLLDTSKYQFSIQPARPSPPLFPAKICLDDSCSTLYKGYSWFNQEHFTRVFKRDGAYYMFGPDDDEPVMLEVD